MAQWVMATRAFGYNGKSLRRGQVLKTEGCRNDGLLIKHGHFQARTSKGRTFKCGECGREFAAEQYRDACGESHELPPALLRKQQLEARVGRAAEAGAHDPTAQRAPVESADAVETGRVFAVS
jgi:hypothetical protein